MNGWTYACLAVGLLFLAAPAGALIPDNITLSTDTPWLTAGSGGSSTVTVLVTNGTSATPVPGAGVDLTVDSAYGSISPVHVVMGSDGKATATFRHGTRSGTATITATVPHEELAEPLTGSGEQQIDHATPHRIANTLYEPKVTAGGTTEIVVRMVDEYGNVVDGRNVAETVLFMASPPAGFLLDGGSIVDELSVPVDDAGNVTATLRIDTLAGENLVSIYPPKPIGSDMISITGVGGLPSSITQVVVPSSGSVPADGKTKVSFTYTLFDEYGNPTVGHGLWVNATRKRLGQPDEHESRLLNTNSFGQVMITYEPQGSVGMAIVTATAAANASVSASKNLEFTSTDPVNMLLSASPQSMPSRDVKDDSVSQLRAKVMDERGNPVEGQTVTFEIVPGSIDSGSYTQTVPPELNTASAITNDNGYALVDFSPGFFAREGESGWNETATGKATVRATWGNLSRDIVLTWKNYPYISVETEVSPETVAVNDTVDVTIRLKGDGWALQPDPIDVVLVIDRSGSMGYTDVSPTRMAAAKTAASTFIDQMNPDRDRIGLVSFSSSTTVDNELGDSFEAVTTKLNALPANGATQLRRGIYEAILMQEENTDRPDAVKAVVIMTDGDWNYDGSPIGHGTGYPADSAWAYPFSGSNLEPDNYRYYDGLGGTLQSGTKKDGRWDRNYEYCLDGEFTNQNMSRFASDNNVKLYMVTFAYNPSITVQDTMCILSTSTGGFYEHARNGDDLTDIYERIAGELKTEAGVDTEMDIVFENVEVNGNFTTGTSVFDYVYEDGESTVIESWVDNETGHYEIIRRHTRDDRPNWTGSNPNLPFNIGTVRLGQTWETTFRLAVKTEGNINIFGPGSTITFDNGTGNLTLPDTFITAVPLNYTGMDFAALEITNLMFTGTEPVDEFLPVAWDLNYTGIYTVTEDLFYSNDNEYTWVKFDSLNATNTTTDGASTLDVRGLPPGEYVIRIRGSAPDTEDASAKITQNVTAGATGDAYIRIR